MNLERRRLLAGLFDFEPHGSTVLDAQEVRDAGSLEGATGDLQDPPAASLGRDLD
jgi:hypothetical protein